MYLNFDFLSVGIAVASNLILGSIVFLARKRSTTNLLFLLLTIALSLWSIVNYFSYQAPTKEISLLLVRLVMLLAVPIGNLFFLFAKTFPSDDLGVSKKYLFYLNLFSIITMILTQTPLLFSDINFNIGQPPKPIVGPAIVFFLITPILAIILGIIQLFKGIFQIEDAKKKQQSYLSIGVASMFLLIIIFDFALPSFLNNTKFIPYAALFTLPFVIFTTYAIVKHHLLNLKIIATESLIFVLSVAMFFEVIISEGIITIAFRFFIFLLILGAGILLIKSVRKEVEQREQLQILTSELEGANVKLKSLDQARAEFISIASHQLRTPPATIKWYLSAINNGDYGELSPDVKQALVKTERVNNSLISLIEDILNVSRIERGKMEFLFEEVQMGDLAELTYETLLPIAGEKKLDLQFQKPPTPLPKVMADREKIRQVMNNLIDNALKYTKQGSVVASIFVENGNIRFQVKDSGKGVSPEEKQSIFKKFSRGKESVMQSAGMGLGLYVAQVIIEQHKGKIWVESEGQGKGSTFIFTVPIKNDLKRTTLLDLAEAPQ
jgi:signal transduction histidine kinase